jgi:predicted amidophosphoribosyltransferase
MLGLQRALSLVYPDRCLVCETPVERSGGLCAACWRETPFLTGLVCDACGVPLPGEEPGAAVCDDCLALPRPWSRGRAALEYSGAGRRIVLSIKHADRLDLVPAAARWMTRAGYPVLAPGTLLVPVPVHWTRLLRRRYNQAAELSRALAHQTGLDHCPDALIRTVRTAPQEGMTVEQRFAHLGAALAVHPKRAGLLKRRSVCLIDDVMTSGATLSYAAEALLEAGATQVCVLVLARVVKVS